MQRNSSLGLKNVKVLVTGSNGFIGKNLIAKLNEFKNITIKQFVRGNDPKDLFRLIAETDIVFHLAGENRPDDDDAFFRGNIELTETICESVTSVYNSFGRYVPLVFTSSIHAKNNTPYGQSKLTAENLIKHMCENTGNPGVIFRLPGVFGKWCKPNYNSVVATFCHNIANNIPISISESDRTLELVYIDDVISAFMDLCQTGFAGFSFATVDTVYSISLGELANRIQAFSESRSNLISERVGTGLTRALYSTYVSYLPAKKFAYHLPHYSDERGMFVEMMKTQDSGQFSYFTAHPGVTRGGHYHHSKTEKFLVVKGEALFCFRDLLTNELIELRTSCDVPKVVETIPGWAHEITNVGEDEMIVMLWANENFDPEKPDTVACKVLK